MLTIGRFFFLICLGFFSFIAHASHILGYNGNSIIRQLYFDPDYQFWIKINLEFVCTEGESLHLISSQLKELKNLNLIGTKVIYVSNWDIVNCKENIIELAKLFNQNNFLLALNFDLNLNLIEIFDNNLEFKSDFFNKYKADEFKDIDLWISYVVFKNIHNFFTVNERREVLLKLRELFPRARIGFMFDNEILEDQDGIHPLRKNIDWDQIKPVDDDGDFIITPWNILYLKRTLVISDGSWIGYNDGQIIRLKN